LEGADPDQVNESFAVFDQNGNGYINVKELLHLMGSLGEGLSDSELATLQKISEPDDEQQVNIRHLVGKLTADH